ncbi:hypothetical protein MPER_02977, partial [Moniliophthora perniciosa FA553]
MKEGDFGPKSFWRLGRLQEQLDPPATETESADELKVKAMIEKKTVINLLEAFSVAVKHYLRGEDGIYYEDLYYLVKFLPAYALPPGIPSSTDLTKPADPHGGHGHPSTNASSPESHPSEGGSSFVHRRTTEVEVEEEKALETTSEGKHHLPLP